MILPSRGFGSFGYRSAADVVGGSRSGRVPEVDRLGVVWLSEDDSAGTVDTDDQPAALLSVGQPG